MSIVLDGKLGLKSKEQSNSNDNDDNLDWTGIWQFAKDKTSNLAFNYKKIGDTIPCDLMNYVSFLSSESRTPHSTTTINRRNSSIGRGRGGGRSSKKKILQARIGTEGSIGQHNDSLLNNNSNNNNVKNENNSIEMEQEENNNDNNSNEDFEEQTSSNINDDKIVKNLWQEEEGEKDEQDKKIVDNVINDKTIDKIKDSNLIEGTKLDSSIHPLIGLWEGSFDVKSPINEGEFDKCHEIFFFHSKLGHANDVIFQSLPPEPHFSYTIVKNYEFGRRFTSEIGGSSLYLPGEDDYDDEEVTRPVLLSQHQQFSNDEKVDESKNTDNIDINVECIKKDKNSDTYLDKDTEIDNEINEKKIDSLSSIKENNSLDNSIENDTNTNSIEKTNKNLLQVFVGFGRNAYGRFSLTATLDDITGNLCCEKRYMLTKFSSAKRVKRSLSTEDGLDNDEMASRFSMSTRPRQISIVNQLMGLDANGLPCVPIPDPTIIKRRRSSNKNKQLMYHQNEYYQNYDMNEKELKLSKRKSNNQLVYDNNIEYIVDADDDYRSAFIHDDSGEIYEGGWVQEKRHGRGICLYTNGTMYEGNWNQGKPHGRGQLLTGDRQVMFIGEWFDGLMHGHGTYSYPCGDKYTGDWREGNRHGRGDYVMIDGCRYFGDWRDNKRHGRGIFTWPDGSKYDGEWENDVRQGRGNLELTSGFKYDGSWANNHFEGRGVCIFPGGQEYQGTYKFGLREGRGSIKFKEGAIYEGRFRDDRIDGQGTINITETVPGVENDSFMIPIQIQADIRRIHQKAGFGDDSHH